jgi:anti-sigma-K factor RskA
MASRVDRHLDEEAAEKYSLGILSARKVAEIEEHLLICEPCRQAVAASDAYVAAMRKAAAELRKAAKTKTGPRAGEGRMSACQAAGGRCKISS